MSNSLDLTRRSWLGGIIAGILRAQDRTPGTPPPGPSGPVRIKADRPTLLLGDEATIAGGPRPGIVGDGAKRLQVRNWSSADDSFTWHVDVPAAGEFNATALTKSKGAVLQLKCGEQVLERAVSTGWDRIDFGSLRLARGRQAVTLRAPKPVTGMEFYSLELASPELNAELWRDATNMRSSTRWMRDGKYGLQFHWTSMSAPRRGPRKSYIEAARDFPAQEFARMVAGTGAGYAIITTSHAEHYFPAPIKAIDRIKPGRTAKRDLVADWIEALGAHGVKLMLYYHVGHDDWNRPDGWWRATGYNPKDPRRFLDNWTAITSEVGERYGKGLAGWFFDDGCVYYPLNPDFRTLTQAAKAGNPERLVCYNPWVLPRLTDFQDYFCGEGYDFLKFWNGLPADGSGVYTSGPQKGLQAHTNFILESDWPHSKLNTDIPPPRYEKRQFLADMQAGIEHGVVPSVNLEIYQDGGVGPVSLEYMEALRAEIRPAANS